MEPWEVRAFGDYWRGGLVERLPTRSIPSKEAWHNPDFAWKAESLRRAIALAPGAFGHAGRTPFHIRRWRTLLPIAEAYDTRCDALEQRYRLRELSTASREAETAKSASYVGVGALTATTIDGLAIKARHCDIREWRKMGSNWASLLASAAAVSGVTLSPPEPDET